MVFFFFTFFRWKKEIGGWATGKMGYLMTFIWEASRGLTVWGVGLRSQDILMPALLHCQIAGDSFSQQLHTDPTLPDQGEEQGALAQGGRKAQVQVELCHHPLLPAADCCRIQWGREGISGREKLRKGQAVWDGHSHLQRHLGALCLLPCAIIPTQHLHRAAELQKPWQTHSWTSNGGVCWRLDSNSKITQTRRCETCWKRGIITKNGHLGYLGISLWFRVTR